MIVEVHHARDPFLTGSETALVARVTTHVETADEALETAYSLTQNVFGSWSRGHKFDSGEVNEDYDPRIEVVEPIKVVEGVSYGHRSSMLGDKFVIGDDTFLVNAVGFKRVV